MPSAINKAVVFIHGAGGSAKQWGQLIDRLGLSQAYCYEMPGHGDRNDYVAASIDAATDDLCAYLDALPHADYYIVSHSLGGLLALNYTHRFPEKVAGLVLMSTAAKILLHPDMVKQLCSGEFDGDFLKDGFRGEITKQNMALVISDFDRLNMQASADDFMGVSECNLTACLPEIENPALVLLGEEDKIISPRRTRELDKRLPSSNLERINNAAHYPHLENIEQTAQYMEAFLVGE